MKHSVNYKNLFVYRKHRTMETVRQNRHYYDRTVSLYDYIMCSGWNIYYNGMFRRYNRYALSMSVLFFYFLICVIFLLDKHVEQTKDNTIHKIMHICLLMLHTICINVCCTLWIFYK